MYAKIKDSQVEEYPFDLQKLKQDNPTTSFPDNFYKDLTSLLEYGVVLVYSSNIPEYNSKMYKLVEGTPSYNGSTWMQVWKIIPLNAEEIQDSIESFKKVVSNKVQARLDVFATTRDYDNIISAISYINSNIPKFAIEAHYAMQARDLTWSRVYEIFLDVTAGIRPVPVSYYEVEQELPVLEWPSI